MSNKQLLKRNKWAIDFNAPPKGCPPKHRSKDQSPVGYSDQKIGQSSSSNSNDAKLISKEIMEYCSRTIKTNPNEFIYNVYEWKFYFNISHYDYWNDDI